MNSAVGAVNILLSLTLQPEKISCGRVFFFRRKHPPAQLIFRRLFSKITISSVGKFPFNFLQPGLTFILEFSYGAKIVYEKSPANKRPGSAFSTVNIFPRPREGRPRPRPRPTPAPIDRRLIYGPAQSLLSPEKHTTYLSQDGGKAERIFIRYIILFPPD